MAGREPEQEVIGKLLQILNQTGKDVLTDVALLVSWVVVVEAEQKPKTPNKKEKDGWRTLTAARAELKKKEDQRAKKSRQIEKAEEILTRWPGKRRRKRERLIQHGHKGRARSTANIAKLKGVFNATK